MCAQYKLSIFYQSETNLVFGNIKYLDNICDYLLNKKVFVCFCQVLLSVFVYKPISSSCVGNNQSETNLFFGIKKYLDNFW